MTQAQLDCAVADALGESLHVVHHLGFNFVECPADDLEPENLRLAVECPFCGRAIPFPGALGSGELPLAECDRCDVYFEITDDEIFAADV